MDSANLTARRVLIAEDNRALADVVRFNLTRSGFVVTVARDGKEAQEHLERAEFDCVVTDYQMPRMNGEEVCRWMRTQPALLDLPVILLSAKGLEVDQQRMRRELGVRAFLFKPFSPRELAETVSECLAAGVMPG